MAKIILNKQGSELYGHLADEWLTVYGFNSNTYSFLIWDYIIQEWIFIPMTLCVGNYYPY